MKDFVAEMNHLGEQNEVLIVSGSGAKARFNSVSALQRLRDDRVEVGPKISVAYNPFFPEEQDLADERRRLEQKLETGLVSNKGLSAIRHRPRPSTIVAAGAEGYAGAGRTQL